MQQVSVRHDPDVHLSYGLRLDGLLFLCLLHVGVYLLVYFYEH